MGGPAAIRHCLSAVHVCEGKPHPRSRPHREANFSGTTAATSTVRVRSRATRPTSAGRIPSASAPLGTVTLSRPVVSLVIQCLLSVPTGMILAGRVLSQARIPETSYFGASFPLGPGFCLRSVRSKTPSSKQRTSAYPATMRLLNHLRASPFPTFRGPLGLPCRAEHVGQVTPAGSG